MKFSFFLTPPRPQYVTGPPGLTRNVRPEEVVYAYDRFYRYFETCRIPRNALSNVRVATLIHPSEGLLASFSLKPTWGRNLVRDKKRHIQTAQQFLKFLKLRASGSYVPYAIMRRDPALYKGGAIGAPCGWILSLEPYVSTPWWPPAEADLRGFGVFEGDLGWRVADLSPGRPYHLLFHETTGKGFLIAY